jgi:hypothetical protein
MFARCTTIQGDPDMADQAIKMMEEQVLPFGRQLEGFAGLLAFVDRESGKSLSITLWDSEEARAESVEAANRVRKEVSAELDASILSIDNYELVIDAR